MPQSAIDSALKTRICIITGGHLATCPRMLKAADALAEDGYDVRVISVRYVPWAIEADRELYRRRAGLWRWTEVNIDYASVQGTCRRIWSGLRLRASQSAVRGFGPDHCPLPVVASAYNRTYPELLGAALAEPADLYYGGTGGGLAVAAQAACRHGVPFALDLEDFHSSEQDGAPMAHALVTRIEKEVLPRAVFLTAGSKAIAEAYGEKYGVAPVPVNNTFSLPTFSPDLAPSPGLGLKLYWFSQTIGPKRGLEDVVLAMGLAGIPGELHLRGKPISEYLQELRDLAGKEAPQLRVVHHEPAEPDRMIELCRPYDVGLALEQPRKGVLNIDICLSNKALTYILGGLAVIFSDTEGQRPLALDLSEGAILYKPGDTRTLADGLLRWARDKRRLHRARSAAWEAARRRWHWEHPLERGVLLGAVASVIKK